LIRRQNDTPPENRTDGTSVYNERNDKDNQDITSIHYHTDTGLSEDYIYCYSAWAYDERTNTYSNGFVLACGGVPPSSPTNLTMSSTTNSFNLSWTKGSSTNTVIRRSINTPPQNQEQGTLVYNSTSSSFADTDITLTKNTTYCYSIWSYNPTTASLSTEYLSACGTLSNMATPTNLSFPTVAYNSIILNWTPGTGSTNTLIVRKQGSIPTSRTDGTTIYEDNGNAFIDTGLTDSANYCYAIYATDGEEYTDPLTGCQSTQGGNGLISHLRFNEGSGITAYDSVSSNTGTLANSPTWNSSANCVSGSCIQFGGGNYVSITDLEGLSTVADNSFTIGAWSKIFDKSDYHTIIRRDNYYNQGSENRRVINIETHKTTGYVGFGLYDGTGYGVVGNIDRTDNKWHHFMGVYDAINKNMYLYVDGVLEGSSLNIGVTSYNTMRSPWTVGTATPYYPHGNMSGLIDDVRIYNYALSPAEVNQVYDLGINSLNEINGLCGSSNGSSYYSIPTENLCSFGAPSVVSGVGPWTWTCAGTSASVSCSANKSVDGECGTANKEFYATTTGYGSSTFCSVGSSSPTSPTFPTSGNPVSWQCNGINGGSIVTCNASKLSSVCISGGGLTCSESIDGLYTINKYTLAGTTTGTSTWTPPAEVTQVEYLVVAGGGGGGGGRAGGGGAGGYRAGLGFTLSDNNPVTVVVGAGGAGGEVSGGSGKNSTFSTITSIGGGGGGGFGRNGLNGGSGGGAGDNYQTVQPLGGNGTSGQGNNGGSSYGPINIPRNTGGGGGAGGNGLGGAQAPNGGPGLSSSITGTSHFYAAGGGGGGGGADATNYGIGIGGSSIGGSGGDGTILPTNGANHTGSGGGGGGYNFSIPANQFGGFGGSGIVIIRYLTPQ